MKELEKVAKGGEMPFTENATIFVLAFSAPMQIWWKGGLPMDCPMSILLAKWLERNIFSPTTLFCSRRVGYNRIVFQKPNGAETNVSKKHDKL